MWRDRAARRSADGSSVRSVADEERITLTATGVSRTYTIGRRKLQAVREADGRGARVRAIHVRLDTPLDRGWVPDRPVFYRLVDLSSGSWIVTLAYDPDPPSAD
jgi:hypothetical protein